MNSVQRCGIVAALVLSGVWSAVPSFAQQAPAPAGEAQVMSLDVKETDIRDVIRMISRGYNLNIILDNEVSGKVTLHLSDVPIMEGLRSLARSQGLQVTREGSVYRIRKATTEERSSIRFHRGRLTVDVENVDVNDFIKEVSSKTAVSIVPDSKISGKVSGKLYEVPVDDGLIAILEGSGFMVTKRRNIYRVSGGEGGGVATAAAYGGQQQPARRNARNKGFYIDYSNGKLTIEVSNGNLDDVIKEIADQSDIEIVTYGNLAGEVNAVLNNVPLAEAFTLLLGGTKFTFVQKDNVILIGDRNTATPSGQALSKSELIHLKHIKADEVPKILPKNVPAANIKVVKEQNALLVSGTSEDIVKTREFLETIDIPTPQVVIDAVVVEYSRDLDRAFGLEFGNDGTGKTGSNNYSYPSLQYNRKGKFADEVLEYVGFKDKFISRLPETFYLSLKALETEGKAKVLAQPAITVLNGNKATINVGQTQYFKIIGGTSENPTYRFQPISFGIQLNITPWISQSGQITAEITPEISNAMGTNEEGYPNVFKRSVSTTVRLDNGQTLILGGLLRTDEQASYNKVPFLADIPILGYIFKSLTMKKVKTNLVIYITPRLVDSDDFVDLSQELRDFEKDVKKGFRNNIFSDFANENEKAAAKAVAEPPAKPKREKRGLFNRRPRSESAVPQRVPEAPQSARDSLSGSRADSAAAANPRDSINRAGNVPEGRDGPDATPAGPQAMPGEYQPPQPVEYQKQPGKPPAEQ
jgi:type IV pilus assembly protein PilQ